MSQESGNPFWDYTLAFYGKPGVAPALIGLQDRRGLDVNMLLYCCWAGAQGRLLSAADLAAVDAVAEPWQAEVVRPLRALRRRLKGGFADLPVDQVEAYRKRINALEIDGERIAQDAMARMPAEPGAADAAVADRVAGNLAAYLEQRRVVPDAADKAAMETLLRACCPDA